MRRKKTSGSATPSSVDQTEVPLDLADLVARAGPVKILAVDLDLPLPAIAADDHYHDARIVFFQRDVCRGELTIDLTNEATLIHDQVHDEASRLRSPLQNFESVGDSLLPRITVVVPTVVARTEELRLCIENIGLLDYPDFELILVDNRRTTPHPDPLTEMVKDRLWLKVVRESKPGISAARNKGVAESTGEFIAFTDDDVYVDRQWLRAIGTRFMRDPALDAVSGLILPSELESPAQIWFERYYGGFNGQRSFEASTLEAGGSRSKFLRGSRIVVRNDKGIEIKKFSIYGVGAYAAGANMAFRKSALERIGGFDVALGTGTPARGGEDLAAVISTLWTGGRLGFEPSALAHHRHRREYSELLTLMDGNGIGFTALLTSLVRNDPRHLLGLGSQLSLGIRQIIVQRARKIRGVAKGTSSAQSTEPLFPAELAHREFRAYLRGPAAYFKSRRVWSRLENDKG